MRHSILALFLCLVVAQIARSQGGPPGEIATLHPRGGTGFGALAFSPDGRLLASSDGGGKIRIWDVRTARRRYTLKVADANSAETPAFTFSPDGKLLASAVRSEVRLWDVQSGKQQGELKMPSDLEPTNLVNIECLAFRPDGKRLVGVGAGEDLEMPATPRKFTSVISWDTETGKAAESEKLDGANPPLKVSPNPALQLSADGSSLAYFALQPRGAGYFLRVRDLAAKKDFDVSFEKPDVGSHGYLKFALSPDGKVAAIGDKLLDVAADKELVTLKKINEATPQIGDLCFSPDGKFVAAVGGTQRGETNDSIFLYDVKTGLEVFAFKAHEKEIYSLAITRDGQTMASASEDGTVKLWDLDP